nr:putative zinc finger, CCHC-type [Tanacetum cinerariifolium]
MQLAKKKTARKVWEPLKTRFIGAYQVQKARLHTFKNEFEELRMKDGESIDEYAGKLSRMISKCFECQQFGHFASECINKKEPKQEVHLMRKIEEETLLLCVKGEHIPSMVMLNEDKVLPKRHESQNSSSRDMWYLDNEASNHMTKERNLFAELNKSVTGRVWFGDSSAVEIKGKVTLLFQCKNGD